MHVQDVVRVILTLMQRYCQGDRDIWSTNNSDNETVCASSGESTSTGTRTRIFNVGGPQPLSRLDVARSLCTALGSQLEVVDSANAASAYVSAPGTGASASGVTAISLLAGSGDNRCDKDCAPLPTWKVYVMDSPTDTAQQVL